MSLDWERTQREAKQAAARAPATPGGIFLESWIDTKRRRQRPFPSVLAAVEAAWQGRPARLTGDGLLSIALEGPSGPYTLKQRIRAHGSYISGASWRAMKALLTT